MKELNELNLGDYSIVIIFFGIVFSLLYFIFIGHKSTYIEGERDGVVVRISLVGVLNKTNEVEIIKGGLSNGEGAFGIEPFRCTIKNNLEVLLILHKALKEQKSILMTYHIVYAASWDSSSGGCFVDKVKIK